MHCQTSMADCSGESWRIVFPDLRSVSRVLHPCQLGRDRGRSTLREGSPWKQRESRPRFINQRNCEKSIGKRRKPSYVPTSWPISEENFTTFVGFQSCEMFGSE